MFASIHRVIGYALFAYLLLVIVVAIVRARSSEPFADGLLRIAGLALALQFVLGVVAYVTTEAWNATWPQAVAHPVLMFLAVGVAQQGAVAGRSRAGAEAWRRAAAMTGIATVLVVAGIGAASAA